MEFVLAIVILLLDQGTKIWAERALSRQPLVLIPEALELTYLENRGAVWGLMQGWRIVFLVATFVFLCILVWFYAKKRKDMTVLTRVILSLLFAGAIGNLIDRVFLGYVRDMIYFSLINFPVFNVADSAITIAAALLVIETFFHQEQDHHIRPFGILLPQEGKETERWITRSC